jgi:hypothetical protein
MNTRRELLRHFLDTFFDSESLAVSGEWKKTVAGVFAALISAVGLSLEDSILVWKPSVMPLLPIQSSRLTLAVNAPNRCLIASAIRSRVFVRRSPRCGERSTQAQTRCHSDIQVWLN